MGSTFRQLVDHTWPWDCCQLVRSAPGGICGWGVWRGTRVPGIPKSQVYPGPGHTWVPAGFEICLCIYSMCFRVPHVSGTQVFTDAPQASKLDVGECATRLNLHARMFTMGACSEVQLLAPTSARVLQCPSHSIHCNELSLRGPGAGPEPAPNRQTSDFPFKVAVQRVLRDLWGGHLKHHKSYSHSLARQVKYDNQKRFDFLRESLGEGLAFECRRNSKQVPAELICEALHILSGPKALTFQD
jgi:hypothetical protein